MKFTLSHISYTMMKMFSSGKRSIIGCNICYTVYLVCAQHFWSEKKYALFYCLPYDHFRKNTKYSILAILTCYIPLDYYLASLLPWHHCNNVFTSWYLCYMYTEGAAADSAPAPPPAFDNLFFMLLILLYLVQLLKVLPVIPL